MSAPHAPIRPQRVAFLLTLWTEPVTDAPPHWRGYLESADGQRRYFRSLADLNQLLREASHWADPVDTPMGDPS